MGCSSPVWDPTRAGAGPSALPGARRPFDDDDMIATGETVDLVTRALVMVVVEET
jgi:hypothetical protein